MGEGFDALIVTFSTEDQANFWGSRLEKQKGALLKRSTQIFSLYEEWPGGAGNGLGTLYAIQKAKKQGLRIESDRSYALFHAAGYGKRLAPLSLAEGGNKSAVLLPGNIEGAPLTLLESVIRQTAPLARRGKGRLSVFWGDQLFLPKSNLGEPHAEIELLVKNIPPPTKKNWEEDSLSSYGINFIDHSLQCLNKLSWEAFSQLNKGRSIGLNLGVFSLSKRILEDFLKEFSQELSEKKGKLDTDPDFWMPATLSEDLYQLLLPKGDLSHFKRMRRFYHSFQEQETRFPLIGTKDIGRESFWWDFGSVCAYYKNALKVTLLNDEGRELRNLLHCPIPDKKGNCLIRSTCDTSHLSHSVIVDVSCKKIEGNHLLALVSNSLSISGNHAILYGVDTPIQLDNNQIIAKKTLSFPLYSSLFHSGKEDWEKILPKNKQSYAKIFQTSRRRSEKSI